MREGERQMKKNKKYMGVAAVFFLALVMAVQVKAAESADETQVLKENETTEVTMNADGKTAVKFVPEKTQKYLFKTAVTHTKDVLKLRNEKSGSEKSVALTKTYTADGIRMVSRKLEKGQTYILYVENPNSQETQKVSVYNDLGYGMKDFQEAAGEKLAAQTNQRYAEYYKLEIPEENAYKIHLSQESSGQEAEVDVYDTDMEKVSANTQRVDANGTWRDNIYHLNAGIYYVEAKMVQSYGTDYTGRESSYSLSLKEPVLHTKLVNPAPTMMEAGESTLFKSDSYEPYDAEDAAELTSSKPDVVKASRQTLTAVSAGSATITAKNAAGEVTATWKVRVINPPLQTLKENGFTNNVIVGGGATFTFIPSKTQKYTFMYSKSNSANIVRETLMDEDGNEIDWSAQMLIGIYKRNVTPVLTEGKSYYIQAETKSGKTEKQQMVALLPNTTLSTTQADIWEKPYENTFTSGIADAGMPASNVVKVNFEKAGTYVLTDSADEESLDATELELYTLGIDKIAGKSQRVGLAKETQFEIPEAGTYYLAINVDADEADYSIQGREGTLTPQPEPTPEPKPETVKVSKIKITGATKIVAAGKSVQLKAAVAPSKAANKAITWKSSNTKYAVISKTGKVTTKTAGKGKHVTITATAKDGSKVSGNYKIKIAKGIVKKVNVTAPKTVKAGKTVKLKVKVTATAGAYKTLSWTSSNTKYATVSKTGKVTAKKAGKGKTVKITAKALDGSGKKAVVKLKIK